jgi:hypothetical protein
MRGRRSTKNRDERIAALQVAINRSGFTGLEVLQILVDWLKWSRITASLSGGVEHTITGSLE